MIQTYIVSTHQEDCIENPRDDYPNLGKMYTWHPRYTLGGKDDYNNQINRIENFHAWVYNWMLSNYEQSTIFGNFDYDYETLMYQDHEADEREQLLFKTLIEQWLSENCKLLPIYLYDHSGITINTKPFSCPWDSGQVGFIYVTKAEAEKQGVKFEECESILEDEIKTLDQYLTGDIWCYSIYRINPEMTEEEYETVLDDIFEEYDPSNCYEDETRKIYTTGFDIPETQQIEFVSSCGGFYGYDYMIECIIDTIKS